MTEPKKLYRYERRNFSEDIYDISIILLTYNVVKETPKGFWFIHESGYGGERWTSNEATRRHAYPTREEALNSFAARTRRSILLTKRQLRVAEAVQNKVIHMLAHGKLEGDNKSLT